MNRPRLGVSACLVGREVRYDGGHKRLDPLMGVAEHFELVPICPEAELGLGVPRPPMHLEQRGGRVHMLVTASGLDQSEAMADFARRRLGELGPVDGYLFKSRSPSCALASAPIGGRDDLGAGLFASAFTARYPQVPAVEEGAFDQRFVRRVFAHWRERRLAGLESPGQELIRECAAAERAAVDSLARQG